MSPIVIATKNELSGRVGKHLRLTFCICLQKSTASATGQRSNLKPLSLLVRSREHQSSAISAYLKILCIRLTQLMTTKKKKIVCGSRLRQVSANFLRLPIQGARLTMNALMSINSQFKILCKVSTHYLLAVVCCFERNLGRLRSETFSVRGFLF